MKAVVQIGYNDDFSKAITFDSAFPIPVPKPGEVLIKIACTASNPVDYKLVNGTLKNVNALPLPVALGRDFSGVIENLDQVPVEKLNGMKVGDRVCGYVNCGVKLAKEKGSFAEYLTTPIAFVAKIPESVSFAQAAALPLVANTTYQALHEVTGLTKGAKQKVLVLGGSTATGMLALQMCRDYGCAEVVTTSSSEEMCKAHGATEVFNYKKGGKWEVDYKDRQFDIVYDCVGGHEHWAGAQLVMKPYGKFVTIVGDYPHSKFTAGKALATGAYLIRRKFRQTFGPKHFAYNQRLDLGEEANRGLTYFLQLIDQLKFNTVDPNVKHYPFTAEGAVDMYKKQASGTCKGKLVMEVAADLSEGGGSGGGPAPVEERPENSSMSANQQ